MLWEGQDKEFPVYGSGCYRGWGHDGMIEKAQKFVSDGFKSIKMQVAHIFSNEEDICNVRDMRQVLGSNIGIMIDVNQGWSVEETIKVSKQIWSATATWVRNRMLHADQCVACFAECLRCFPFKRLLGQVVLCGFHGRLWKGPLQ